MMIFFLKKSTTFAPFQVAGNIHCVKDIFKRRDKGSQRDWAHSFNTLLLMKSAPAALFESKIDSAEKTSSGVVLKRSHLVSVI